MKVLGGFDEALRWFCTSGLLFMSLNICRNVSSLISLAAVFRLNDGQTENRHVIGDERARAEMLADVLARKMVAYLLAVDRQAREFVPAEEYTTAAA